MGERIKREIIGTTQRSSLPIDSRLLGAGIAASCHGELVLFGLV